MNTNYLPAGLQKYFLLTGTPVDEYKLNINLFISMASIPLIVTPENYLSADSENNSKNG